MRQSGIAVTPSFEHLNACKATATQAVGGLLFFRIRGRGVDQIVGIEKRLHRSFASSRSNL